MVVGVEEFNPNPGICRKCIRNVFDPAVDNGEGVCRMVGFRGHPGECHWNGVDRGL